MKKFATTEWEVDKIGESVHKQLFENNATNKVKSGRVKKLKKKRKVKNEAVTTAIKNLNTEVLTNKKNIKEKKKSHFNVKYNASPNVNKRSKTDSNKQELQLVTANSVQKDKKQAKKGRKHKNSELLSLLQHESDNHDTTLNVKKPKLKSLKKLHSVQTINEPQNSKADSAKKKRKRKKKRSTSLSTENLVQSEDVTNNQPKPTKVLSKYKQKLQQLLQNSAIPQQQTEQPKKKKRPLSLRERMMEKLNAAKFRYINQQIYTKNSKEAKKLFENDKGAFKEYHEGYKQQVERWPLNPVDVIIKSIRKMPENSVIADFGCGEAKLAQSVKHTVHSFDLVALNGLVKACDMSSVPLKSNTVDVAVFCLSLMGTNLKDYLVEANRVLKVGGLLKIAEVESRFDGVEAFVKGVEYCGFKKVRQDFSHNLFYFFDFKKALNVVNKKKIPDISLKPCMYKKR